VCALGWGGWGRREDSDSEKSMNNKVFQTFCVMSVAFVRRFDRWSSDRRSCGDESVWFLSVDVFR